MSREEFLRELERLLGDIPELERREAIEYYRNYFEDAGPENEAKIIKELGSPEKVAASIKKDLFGEDNDKKAAEDQKKQQAAFERQKRENRTLRNILIGIAVVLTFPLWIGVAAAAFGILVAAIACVFGFAVAAVAVVGSLLVAGCVLVGIGVMKMFVGLPAVGFLIISIGLICLALCILGLIAAVWFVRCVPWVVRAIVRVCKLPFQRRGAKI